MLDILHTVDSAVTRRVLESIRICSDFRLFIFVYIFITFSNNFGLVFGLFLNLDHDSTS